MKKYKVIFNSSMDINSFQKKYFNNAFNSNVYLLEKNASNNFLSFIRFQMLMFVKFHLKTITIILIFLGAKTKNYF